MTRVDRVGDDRVTRWLSFDSRTPEQAQAMLDGILARAQLTPGTVYYLAVTLPNQPDAVIGFARLGLGGPSSQARLRNNPEHAGNGYATDAAMTLIDYGFHTLRLHRISAAIGPDNHASIVIAKRLDMTYEGRLRDHVHTNGAWRDSLLYSLPEPEWRNLPEPSARSQDRAPR